MEERSGQERIVGNDICGHRCDVSKKKLEGRLMDDQRWQDNSVAVAKFMNG